MSRPLLGRVVQDRTGLTGRYKIDLDYPFVLPPNSDPTLPDPRPWLFTVIREQLGMKLVPARGQFKRIVVDDAQRLQRTKLAGEDPKLSHYLEKFISGW